MEEKEGSEVIEKIVETEVFTIGFNGIMYFIMFFVLIALAFFKYTPNERFDTVLLVLIYMKVLTVNENTKLLKIYHNGEKYKVKFF